MKMYPVGTFKARCITCNTYFFSCLNLLPNLCQRLGKRAVSGYDFVGMFNLYTKTEKISLLVNMFSIGPYIFLSFLSMLWGIVPGSPESAFGELVYDATLFLGSIFFIIAAVAAIATLILRKIGKAKASIWINVIALAYIVLVLSINALAGKVF